MPLSKIYIIKRVEYSDTQIMKATTNRQVAFDYLDKRAVGSLAWYVEVWQDDRLIAYNRFNHDNELREEEINSVLDSNYKDYC